MACSKKKLIYIEINIQKYSYYHCEISKDRNIAYNNFYNLDNDNYLINGEKGGFKLFGREKNQAKKNVINFFIYHQTKNAEFNQRFLFMVFS